MRKRCSIRPLCCKRSRIPSNPATPPVPSSSAPSRGGSAPAPALPQATGGLGRPGAAGGGSGAARPELRAHPPALGGAGGGSGRGAGDHHPQGDRDAVSELRYFESLRSLASGNEDARRGVNGTQYGCSSTSLAALGPKTEFIARVRLPEFFNSKVLVPILSSEENHTPWPGCVSQDMEHHVGIMKNKIQIMTGLMSGRIHLPIPLVAAKTDLHQIHAENKQDPDSRAVLHAIDSMVIRWSHQIHATVNRDSAEPLLNGRRPDPQTELNFWKARKDNLLYINKQLQSPVVQKMIKNLKAKESCYYPASQDIFKEVEDGKGREIFVNMLEFQKLKKLDFGGIKGKNLSEQEFEDDYTEFKAITLDLDGHLASVLCVGFHDCSGVLESPEAAFISRKYVEMLKFLDQYEDQTYCEWKVQVDEICQFDLDQPLIKHNPENGLLSVSFDPKLVVLLREVKYLLMKGKKEALLYLDDKGERLAKIYKILQEDSYQIHHLVETQKIFESFKADMKPFKMSLNLIKKFKEYVLRFVIVDGQQHNQADQELEMLQKQMLQMQESAKLFEVAIPDYKQMKQCKEAWLLKKSSIDDWTKTQRQINVEQMDVRLRRFAKEMQSLDKEVCAWDVYRDLELTLKNLMSSPRAILELENPAEEVLIPGHEGDGSKYSAKETLVMVFRALHIDADGAVLSGRLLVAENATLANLRKVEDEVQSIVDNAVKELSTEKILAENNQMWATIEFSYEKRHRNGAPLIKSEQLLETLNPYLIVYLINRNTTIQLQTNLKIKYVAHFTEEAKGLQYKLNMADSVISIWMEVQLMFSHLESIFAGSEEIRSQLPEDANRFDEIRDFKELVTDAANTKDVMKGTTKLKVYENLKFVAQLHLRFIYGLHDVKIVKGLKNIFSLDRPQSGSWESVFHAYSRRWKIVLSFCEKALAEYLETKCIAFPLFYFVSSADLLDILSKGTPKQVAHHLTNLFDNIADLKFQENIEESVNTALGMYSRKKDYVPFYEGSGCSGQVASWLQHLEDTVHRTVCFCIMEVTLAYEERQREQWVLDYRAQVVLTGSQIWWVLDVEMVAQLNVLITVLLGELSSSDQKIMTICTIDVHTGDILASLVAQKLSQLCHGWGDAQQHCLANICDAQFQYFYEYLGNTSRLVITPLTDRCYITATFLYLTISSVSAGSAGTGKTETTKDVGALGMMAYIFNSSEQMDYKPIGHIYKGLVQTGAWGCFDEFNCILVEVLSAVAVQVKTMHNAIRNKKKKFLFLGENITLKSSVGMIITMNPGYMGRRELPENLKALFRRVPCAMVVPDIELMSEIILIAEGFIDAHLLARKFITLYTLCRELLSKQDHYDWGLCAIKSALIVAGSLKGDKNRPEDQVLMRALRDFGLPKVVTDDIPVFMGLISDLFPTLDVLRKRNLQFEQTVKQFTLELLLQAEESFIFKVVTLEELLAVHDSLSLEMWKLEELQCNNTLFRPSSQPRDVQWQSSNVVLKVLHHRCVNMKQKPVWDDLNPKVLTADELFGFIRATREWNDGFLSSLLRKQANITHGAKIVSDGGIDLMWIESLNTVVDDNKILTLTSNEHMSMTPSVRLLFEVHHLRAATQAAISRAGILYLNTQDLRWNLVASWIETRRYQSEKANLTVLFDKYVSPYLEQLRTRFKTVTPIPENSMIRAIFVHTSETARLKYFIDLLLAKGKLVNLVGNARVGKTVFVHNGLAALSEDYLLANIPLNCYTTSAVLQKMLEKKVEKKAGHNYGPVGNKKCIYFIDDLNMPEVDRYQPRALIWQHIDYGHCRVNPCYKPVQGWEPLRNILEEFLESYNEMYASVNLVLFEDTWSVYKRSKCWISCILEAPRGALLIGVGCSAKQSLSRLAAYMLLEVFQIMLNKDYMIQDLRVDLASLYIKTGAKNMPTVFLLTDAQVSDECFLALINDLASGEVPDLFGSAISDEDVEDIATGVRKEVQALNLMDTGESYWRFFLSRVQLQLNIVLCFSATSATLRVGAGKFPAIVNCTAIDWFHERPREALRSISRRFIEEAEGVEVQPLIQDSISDFMIYGHTSVNMLSAKYNHNERYNYTTSKSFLEQIMFCKILLEKKSKEMSGHMEHSVNGMQKLKAAAFQAEDLKPKLASQEAELQLRNQDAEALIAKIRFQSEKVSKEKAIADAEEQKVAAIQGQVYLRQKESEGDLLKAEPALVAATASLDMLKLNLTELKAFTNPPIAVINVIAAVMVLVYKGKVPKDRSWKDTKTFMGKVDDFLALMKCDKKDIHQNCLKVVKEHYLKDPVFSPDYVHTKSFAATGLCAWVITTLYCEVEPEHSTGKFQISSSYRKTRSRQEKPSCLNSNLRKLTALLEKAVAEKVQCQDNSESMRWSQSVENLKTQKKNLCDDVLLTAAFASYFGPFTKQYRQGLMEHFEFLLKSQKVPIPVTESLDPIAELTDDATIVAWSNEGLPSDRMSTENATILTNCKHWPLMKDPQQQGIKWIKNKYGADLKVVRLGQKGFLKTNERALACGETVLVENIGESIDPVLDPLLGHTGKKGKFPFLCILFLPRYIKIECEFNKNFHLILHTKLANPHYKQELQAQTALINFTVTRDGLEDQLLAVVSAGRLDLEKWSDSDGELAVVKLFHCQKSALAKQQDHFKTELRQLEDDMLLSLSTLQGSFLDDSELVAKLEATKSIAAEIQHKIAEAKEDEAQINMTGEHYRLTAIRASILYFVSKSGQHQPHLPVFTEAFDAVFHKAIRQTEKSGDIQCYISNLTEAVTYSTFLFTNQGVFEKDKLIFLAQTAFQSPVDFLTTQSWSAIRAMAVMDVFRGLDKDIERSTKRWKKWVDSECPEKEKLPQEWTNKSSPQKQIILRVLRLDRMMYSLRNYMEEKLGSGYVESTRMDLAKSYEGSPATPVFFILSAGVHALEDTETLSKNLGFTVDSGRFQDISLGQGQEMVAEEAFEKATRYGHFLFQNIHLVAKWLGTLEKLLGQYSEESNPDCHVFISAEPAPAPKEHIIPQGILEMIKITSESPTGMLANLRAALYIFDQDTFELCTRDREFKSILLSQCYFHTCAAGRLKFGPQGWNGWYPFSARDLAVTWEDLHYLFGEIMYDGHITDADQGLCCIYLQEFIRPPVLEGELAVAPGFLAPPNLDYAGYQKYIDMLPFERPVLCGLHPNAEIGCLTTSDNLFKTLLEMQPMNSFVGEGSGQSAEEKFQSRPVGRERLAYPSSYSLADCLQFLLSKKVVHTDESRSYCRFCLRVTDLLMQYGELDIWTQDLVLSTVVWLSGFFSPQSFLTAVMQSMARKNNWPLDKVWLTANVTKEDYGHPPREGALICGLFMEGARWDIQLGTIAEAWHKELTPAMPVIFLRAIPVDRETKNVYKCPLYKTKSRGPNYIWTFNLKSKEKPAK
ncbi:LOW QUALITY PROTEIN: dynein axonemal heavy chain 11 [Cariama cristata]